MRNDNIDEITTKVKNSDQISKEKYFLRPDVPWIMIIKKYSEITRKTMTFFTKIKTAHIKPQF